MRNGEALAPLLVSVIAFHIAACDDGSPASNTSGGADSGLAPDEVALTPKALLGKRLFEDSNLSEPHGQACASCHDAKRAFTGNNNSRIAPVAVGSRPETFGNRNAPTMMYASFSPTFSFVRGLDDKGQVEFTPTGGQFLDGRAGDLIEQAKGPFVNPREMNNASPEAVIAKIRASNYAGLFRSVFGGTALDDPGMAYQHLAEAITAFEETQRFHPFTSKFDDFLRGQAQLSPLEAHGFDLFKDVEKGNCLACHAGDETSHNPADWLFTDFTYDNLGIPRNPAIPDNADTSFFDLGLCKQNGLAAVAPAGFDVESLCGAFKVPTLRNSELTAPYGHNGFFKELREVVRFYVTRDTNPELWYPKDGTGTVQKLNDLPAQYRANVNTTEVPYDRKPGEQPRLTDDEIDAVVAFLKTLTDR
jgi:cytochrome c peroxidase